jgi:DNA mismatch endonuclease, patch repair protein
LQLDSVVDTFPPEKRSDIMRRVHSTDTVPEKRVRSLLHKLGFRFRLHRADITGKPDIVLIKHHTVIFVHGCFWHRHQGCPNASLPVTRQEYWVPKFRRTIERDRKNQEYLRQQGWKVIVVWECETKYLAKLAMELLKLIGHDKPMVLQAQPSSGTTDAEKRNQAI